MSCIQNNESSLWPLRVDKNQDFIVKLEDKEFLLSGPLALAKNYGSYFLLNIQAYPSDGKIEIFYHLKDYKNGGNVFFRLVLTQELSLPSIAFLWPNAEFYEQEIHRKFGVDFDYGPSIESRTGQAFAPVLFKNPLMANQLNAQYYGESSQVKEMRFDTGYQYKNIEQTMQQKKCDELIHYSSLFAGRNTLNYEFLICKSIEDVFEASIPERAQAIRIIWSEFSRIREHAYCLYDCAREIDQFYLMHQLSCIIKNINQFFQTMIYSKGQQGPFTLGGVTFDIDRNKSFIVKNLSSQLFELANIVTDYFATSQFLKDRLDCGHISHSLALSFTLSGPSARASGVNYDLRKHRPYYFYDEIDFDIAVGRDGSTYERMSIRFEEIRQSLSIVSQVIDHLPSGEVVNTSFAPWFDQNRTEATETIYKEWLIQGRPIPCGSFYNCLESANGEIGLWLAGGEEAQRSFSQLRFFSSDMNTFCGLTSILQGEDYENLALNISSLNLNMGEIER